MDQLPSILCDFKLVRRLMYWPSSSWSWPVTYLFVASWNLWQPCRLVVAPGVCFLSYLLSGSGTWYLLCTWYLDLTTWHRAELALGTAAAALPPLGIPTASCLHLPDCRQLRAFCSIMLCGIARISLHRLSALRSEHQLCAPASFVLVQQCTIWAQQLLLAGLNISAASF